MAQSKRYSLLLSIIIAALALFLALVAAELPAAEQPAEISGYRTVHGAQVSARENPIPVRYVYGAERDWLREPYRLAVLLVEFSDRKHQANHTAEFYDQLLFSRDKYHKAPGGEPSFGSVADWYRVQSSDRFELTGKAFDWVTVDETFEAIHALKMSEARERYLKVALAKVRERDGADALENFDGYAFVHVGPITGPTGNIFWSHRADVEGKRYITTGEIDRIGVFCHEFGHMLGLPDFYGKKGERESFGPWCAMAAGYRGMYPKSFCAWSKIRLGWCRPVVVDAAVRQRLVLRPIQSHPNDAFLIPLNAIDDVGAEFLLLENRDLSKNDAEGQAGLFIWQIRRKPASGSLATFELTLPGPTDKGNSGAKDRRVAWPTEKAREFVIKPQTGESEEKPEGVGESDAKSQTERYGVRLRNIRKEGDLVFFEIGPE